jgi:drug/metabolite transporter (DMT)-like permease
MKNYRLRNTLLLLLAALIWGASFVAQRVGADAIRPFTYNGIRMLMGALALLPLILVREKYNPQILARSRKEVSEERHVLLKAGFLCGTFLFLGTTLQQIGIEYTTAGKSGFITAFYIVLVPIFALFLGKKSSPVIWLSVVIALTGLYLICIKNGFSISIGDFYTLLSSFTFAIQILVIDHYSAKVDGIKLSCLQFLVTALFSAFFILILERDAFSLSVLEAGIIPLLYSGLLSSGVAYTLQIVAQKGLNPTVASLVMSMESCFAVISEWLILGTRLSAREFSGCILMFIAIILSDLLPAFSKQARIRRSRKSVHDLPG